MEHPVTVDTNAVKELISTSVRVRIPTTVPDYAGVVERLIDDLNTIVDQAMQDAYTQARIDIEEVCGRRLTPLSDPDNVKLEVIDDDDDDDDDDEPFEAKWGSE